MKNVFEAQRKLELSIQEKQKALFAKYFAMPAKIGAQEWKWNSTGDYILIDTFQGIEFYTPNDECRGAIISVSRKDGLAHNTGFYEMDDMKSEYVDYHQVVFNGVICCQYETETVIATSGWGI